MAGGFIQRYKGKITAAQLWVGLGGFYYNGVNGTPLVASVAPSANGLTGFPLVMSAGLNLDGSGLAAAASAGKFGYTVSLGTAFALVSEVANSNTKTDDVIFDTTLGNTYIAGQNVSLKVNAKLTGAGTLTTKTLTAKAYRLAADGTMGANLIATAAAVLTTPAADYTFVITGATLSPGDRVILDLTSTLTETGAVNTNTQISSVRLG